MKTSKLVPMILALLISIGGIEAINLLFTHASSIHEWPARVLIVRA
jgi:hypothetical protein